MGKKTNNKSKNNKKKGKKKQPLAKTSPNDSSEETSFPSNFVSDAGPGCYIARRDLPSSKSGSSSSLPDWMLEWEDVDPAEFADGEEVPELAIDPEERTLSVCNTRADNQPIVAYITIYETKLRGRHGRLLEMGTTTNNQGVTRECVTFIVVCPPHVFAHLCYLDVSYDTDIFQDMDMESDVQAWNRHPDPSDHHPLPLGFPLQGGPFLCTQGVGGQLTHFFNGNLHAIDFRCPVGTNLLSVGNGVVVEAKDNNTLTGIAVSNLFEWNAIMIRLDMSSDAPAEKTLTTTSEDTSGTPDNGKATCTLARNAQNDNNGIGDGRLFVEYVHIRKSFVKEGDRVTKGQVIGESGSVGFSPEPHLHFAAYRSQDNTAPTVQVHFQSSSLSDDEAATNGQASLYLPIAGNYYDTNGLKA